MLQVSYDELNWLFVVILCYRTHSETDKTFCLGIMWIFIRLIGKFVKCLFISLLNTFTAKRDCSRIYRSLPNATTVEIYRHS